MVAVFPLYTYKRCPVYLYSLNVFSTPNHVPALKHLMGGMMNRWDEELVGINWLILTYVSENFNNSQLFEVSDSLFKMLAVTIWLQFNLDLPVKVVLIVIRNYKRYGWNIKTCNNSEWYISHYGISEGFFTFHWVILWASIYWLCNLLKNQILRRDFAKCLSVIHYTYMIRLV